MSQKYNKGDIVKYSLEPNSSYIGKILMYDCGEYIIENINDKKKSNISESDIYGSTI